MTRDKILSGPWHVDADVGHRIMGGPPGFFDRWEVARVPSYVAYSDEVRTLIAAAPDMATALREATAVIAPLILNPTHDAVAAARTLRTIWEVLDKAFPHDRSVFGQTHDAQCDRS